MGDSGTQAKVVYFERGAGNRITNVQTIRVRSGQSLDSALQSRGINTRRNRNGYITAIAGDRRGERSEVLTEQLRQRGNLGRQAVAVNPRNIARFQSDYLPQSGRESYTGRRERQAANRAAALEREVARYRSERTSMQRALRARGITGDAAERRLRRAGLGRDQRPTTVNLRGGRGQVRTRG